MVKVTVCGAAGGIGQPLSLLLKLNPKITQLSLFDVVNVLGVGADLNHINTNAKIQSFLPAEEGLSKALKDANLVIIPAGVPRKPGMTRDDLFKINAGIVRDLAQGIADNCPKAFILVISNPVNSTVPIFAEVLKKNGVFDPKRLFGVTTLDIVRANTFLSDVVEDASPADYNIPVIGGHSGETIVPLYSLGAKKDYAKLSPILKSNLVHRVQFGGDEVVQAKNGAGSATLSMAYAGYKLADALLDALNGKEITECTYLNLDDSIKGASEAKKLIKGLTYFSLPVVLSKEGIKEVLFDTLGKITNEEGDLLNVAIEQLGGNISKGVSFIKG